MPPIAYNKLKKEELELLCKSRNHPTRGSKTELAARLYKEDAEMEVEQKGSADRASAAAGYDKTENQRPRPMSVPGSYTENGDGMNYDDEGIPLLQREKKPAFTVNVPDGDDEWETVGKKKRNRKNDKSNDDDTATTTSAKPAKRNKHRNHGARKPTTARPPTIATASEIKQTPAVEVVERTVKKRKVEFQDTMETQIDEAADGATANLMAVQEKIYSWCATWDYNVALGAFVVAMLLFLATIILWASPRS